jgi:hypothetical protein
LATGLVILAVKGKLTFGKKPWFAKGIGKPGDRKSSLYIFSPSAVNCVGFIGQKRRPKPSRDRNVFANPIENFNSSLILIFNNYIGDIA